MGKTQIALEYAWRYRQQYRLVLWLNASSEETLLNDLRKMATALKIPGYYERDARTLIAHVKDWLAGQQDWLLIFDNADELAMVRGYLPARVASNGQILLTTRDNAVGALARPLAVEEMSAEEGILFLLRRAHLIAVDASLADSTAEQRTAAAAIVALLGALPLALDQAGAYVRESNISLNEYQHLYGLARKDLLIRRGEQPPGHEESVLTTWQLSLAKIAQAHPAAVELLRLCAFLAPDAIPEELITEGADALGRLLKRAVSNPVVFNRTIEPILRYSLLRRSAERKHLSIHRLVQAVLQEELNLTTRKQWATRAIRMVDQVFPAVNPTTWRTCARYLPQAEHCAELAVSYNLELPEVSSLLFKLGRYWYDQGVYPLASTYLQRCLLLDEKISGTEHADTAATVHALGNLSHAQGAYEQAHEYYERALAIKEKVLGAEHPDTATTLHTLGYFYQKQGAYEQARGYYERALAIEEKVLPAEHPDTGLTLYRLATLYRDRGEFSQAEAYFWRDLAISEKVFGLEHSGTLATIEALAGVLAEQGKVAQAEELLRRIAHLEEEEEDQG